MGTATLTLVLVSFAASLACSPPQPPLVGETEHVRYFAHDPECGQERAAAVDAALDQLAAAIGVELSPDTRLDYYLVPELVHEFCRSDTAEGCTDGASVWSEAALHQHELAHVVLRPEGRPPMPLEEGLAEVFGSGFWSADSIARPNEEMIEWLTGLEPEPQASDYYLRSASFVRWLIDRHGLEAVLELYRSVPADVDLQALDEGFVDALGVDAQSSVSAWVAAGPVPAAATVRPTVECSSPSLSLDGFEPVELGCRTNTINTPAAWIRTAYRSFTVSDGDTAAIALRSERAADFALAVLGCEVPIESPFLIHREAPLATFEPRRTTRVLVLSSIPADYAVQVQSLEPVDSVELAGSVGAYVSETCGDAVPLQIGDDTAELALRRTRQVDWFELDAVAAVELRSLVPVGVDFPVRTVRLHDEGCVSMSQSLGGGAVDEALVLEAGTRYALEVDWGEDSGRSDRLFLTVSTPAGG